jgi:membrane-associated phospholipid phosphatase
VNTSLSMPSAGLLQDHSSGNIREPTRVCLWRLWSVPLFALLGVLLLKAGAWDQSIFVFINSNARALPSWSWECITIMGDTLVGFAVVLPYLRRHNKALTAACIAIVLCALCSYLCKIGFDSPRPLGTLPADMVNVIGPALLKSSFPSGHTITAFVLVALMVGYSSSRSVFALALAVGSLIGLSRIAVGAHWPVDVLGGAALGWLCGFAGLHLAAYVRTPWNAWLRRLAYGIFLFGTLWLLVMHQSGYVQARPLEQLIALIGVIRFARLKLPGR